MIKKVLKDLFKHNSVLFLSYYKIPFYLKFFIPQRIFGDKRMIEKRYEKLFGRKLDLENPKTLTEKLQWLKLNERNDFHTLCADKLRVRDYYSENFGDEYLVPLLFKTDNWREITKDNIPDVPCVLKANTGCGTYKIIFDKTNVDWELLRNQCRLWIERNHYYRSQEWQYKNIKPAFIVEKLLLTKDGKLPNDYKLHFINGKLEFIHCNIDRGDMDYKNFYDSNWNPVNFTWLKKEVSSDYVRNNDVQRPATLDKMIEIGSEIAKQFKYVRVDFYDVDGKLYYGEITLYHGSGLNVFSPQERDLYYGNLLSL